MDGEPLAQAAEIAGAVADLSVANDLTPEQKAQKMATGQKNLLEVLQSGDADALFAAAQATGNLYPNRGAAVLLAACQMAADCSEPGCGVSGGSAVDINDNPVDTSCPAGADFPYMLQKGLGQEAYAALDARAQQIKQMLSAGNYQGVLAYLSIDK